MTYVSCQIQKRRVKPEFALMTAALKQAMPRRIPEGDPMVYVKYYYPKLEYIWYGVAFDGSRYMEGWIAGLIPPGFWPGNDDWDRWDLGEFMFSRSRFGDRVHRDPDFKPVRVSEIVYAK